jgi:nucleoside recognition membrane protein YjiH
LGVSGKRGKCGEKLLGRKVRGRETRRGIIIALCNIFLFVAAEMTSIFSWHGPSEVPSHSLRGHILGFISSVTITFTFPYDTFGTSYLPMYDERKIDRKL